MRDRKKLGERNLDAALTFKRASFRTNPKKQFKSVIQFHFLTLLHYEKRCITKDTFYKKATKQGLK